MSGRPLFWTVAAFLVGSEVYAILDYAQRTSAEVGWQMAYSLCIGIGATLVWCIGLLAEPKREQEKHPAPHL